MSFLVDIQDIPGLGRIQRLEWSLLLREFKQEINRYLASTPREVKLRTLTEVMAFNLTNSEQMMPHFAQEIFELSEETSESDEPDLETLARQLKKLAGPEGIDALLEQANCEFLIAPTFGRPWKIDLENGDNFEGSRSHVVIRMFYFVYKKNAKQTPKILNLHEVPHGRTRPGPAKSGSLREADLRFVHGLYIFFMRFGRPNYRLPARRGFGVRTGKHSCEGSDGVRRP